MTTRHLMRYGTIAKSLVKQRKNASHVVYPFPFQQNHVMQKCFSSDGLTVRSEVPTTQLSLESTPKLQQVPTLPYLGSLISWHSGIPERREDNEYEWLTQMREKYGDFYSYGMPGLGTGTHAIVYCKFYFNYCKITDH
jgi:hypothetical protein